MSLIKCPECNSTISSEATICSKCGYSIHRKKLDVVAEKYIKNEKYQIIQSSPTMIKLQKSNSRGCLLIGFIILTFPLGLLLLLVNVKTTRIISINTNGKIIETVIDTKGLKITKIIVIAILVLFILFIIISVISYTSFVENTRRY